MRILMCLMAIFLFEKSAAGTETLRYIPNWDKMEDVPLSNCEQAHVTGISINTWSTSNSKNLELVAENHYYLFNENIYKLEIEGPWGFPIIRCIKIPLRQRG